MNINKFFLCLLITGAPLFYIGAMEEQVQSAVPLTEQWRVAPLTVLAADAVAKEIYDKKEDLFVLLRTRYKDLPDELKAKIIVAYSKLIPAQHLLSVAINCAQMSDLAAFDAVAKIAISKAAVLEKRDVNKELISKVPANFIIARKQILERGVISEKVVIWLKNLGSLLDSLLPSLDDADRFLVSGRHAWEIYLTGRAGQERIPCILENIAPSCVFGRAALEIVHRLPAHVFFEDQAVNQPLTLICLLAETISQSKEQLGEKGKLSEGDKKFPVALVKEALIALLPENDWVHAVRQLMLENERLAVNLLTECCYMRPYTRGSFNEIYLWACIFDKNEIKKFIEEKSVNDDYLTAILPIIKKLHGDSSITLGNDRLDADVEKIKRESLRADLIRAACRADYAAILTCYEDIHQLETQRLPHPVRLHECVGYDLMEFACKMGYTCFVDALLARGYTIKTSWPLINALTKGHRGLIEKIFNNQEKPSYKNMSFDEILEEIDKDKKWGESGIKGRSSDALKIFIDCESAARHQYRVFDFAQLLAAAACRENREIFDYSIQAVNSEKSDLTDGQKQDMLEIALCLAVAHGAPIAMIQLLVESGAPVNVHSDPNPIDNFIAAGAYKEAHYISGHVLFDAVNRDKPNIEVVKYLLKSGALDEPFNFEHCADIVISHAYAGKLAKRKGLHDLAELLRPAFRGDESGDEPSNDEQSEDEQ